MSEHFTPQEERVLRQVVARTSEQGWGLAIGLIFGLGLLLATFILVARGGENVGYHLNMLRVYFPGYSVTWFGGLVGFVYAFVLGYAVGRTVATLYNKLNPQ
jgi:hypothetical protein